MVENLFNNFSVFAGLTIIMNNTEIIKLDCNNFKVLISQDLQEALSDLSSSIALLVNSNNQEVWYQIAFAIFIAFIGAFSAFLFNYLNWKIIKKKESILKTCSSINQFIDELEKTSIDYWVEDYKENNKIKITCSEITIKSRLRLINKYIDILLSESEKSLGEYAKTNIKKFINDVYDIITGGDFESKSRKASNQIANKISIKCSDMRATLHTLEFRI